MKKKITALFLTLILALCFSTTAFATTPAISPNIPKIPKITVTLPDSIKGAVKKEVEENLKENPITVTLPDSPTITQATFYHKKNSRGWLQIRWDKVEDVKSYEIKITKPDGTSKTYISETSSLLVYEGSDDFIAGCPKQWVGSTLTAATVKIRSIGESGSVGLWSTEKKISCNSLHSKN